MSVAPGSAEPGSGYAGFWLCRVLLPGHLQAAILLSELEPAASQKWVLTHAPLFSSKARVLENIQCSRLI